LGNDQLMNGIARRRGHIDQDASIVKRHRGDFLVEEEIEKVERQCMGAERWQAGRPVTFRAPVLRYDAATPGFR